MSARDSIDTARSASDCDATFLFPPELDVPHITVSVVDDMYSIKADRQDNWLWFAFTGFMRLARMLGSRDAMPRSFASIGIGNGLDAIGAARAFPSLERIVVTNVDDEIVRVAVENVRRNVPAHIEVTGLTGDVCDPLATLAFKIDVVYANLPNIPSDGDDVIDHGTFFRADGRDAEPEIDRYLLGLQRRFLQSSASVLSRSGVAVLMIGGRVPIRIFDRLGRATGHGIDELLSGYKLQTEADNVTSGYAAAETADVTFDFYRHDEGRRIAQDHPGSSGVELKHRLDHCRLTAAQAQREVASGRSVGHVVHMLVATPRAEGGAIGWTSAGATAWSPTLHVDYAGQIG